MKSAQDIHNILVVGTGMMGPGIALSAARGGFNVCLCGRSEASLQRGSERLTENCDRLIQYELADREEIDAARRRIHLTDGLESAAQDADMIIESIVEHQATKQALYDRLCRVCAADAILTTNSSGLSITRLAAAVHHPDRFAGTHFWNPPYLMPLVEVVKGECTSDNTLEVVCQVIERSGKRPVRVLKDIPGYLGNHLQHALWREALALVEKGVATPEDIDTMVKYSFALRMPPLGIFEFMDLVGIDLVQSCHEYLFADLDNRTTPSPVTTRLCAQGHLGAKTGQGFYTWTREKIAERQRRRDEEIVRQLQLAREEGAL